jgi:hypothetical protein
MRGLCRRSRVGVGPEVVPQSAVITEKFYSLEEVSLLLGFAPRFWREQAAKGELTLYAEDGNTVISEPVFIAGELRIPASALNAFCARRPYRPELGEVGRRHRASSGKFGAAV